MSQKPDVRWKQRFQNFSKAIILLQELQEIPIDSFSALEKEGVVQRFEFTLELAWKTLKDKMEEDGIIIDRISPKIVLKQAFNSKYIENIELWIEMVNDRNMISHCYDMEQVHSIIQDIQAQYIPLLLDFYTSLRKEINE
jgi:nucleotidyltransferase substrate binding protein (TIGR01987 family)